MKSKFVFKLESSEKMVKTSKFVSQKQNKTKKNWRQTIKTSEFECFDVRPLPCNFFSFFKQKTRSTALILLISCLKIYHNKFSHALLFWYKYMHRNCCFRLKQHSYAACDAALAASFYTSKVGKKLKKCLHFVDWFMIGKSEFPLYYGWHC